MFILALVNACTTLVYFSQMYMLYNFFDPDTVYLATISYAYIAQGAGLLLFIILYSSKSHVFGNRFILTGILIAMVPIALMTIQIHSGYFLMCLLVFTNILIGYSLGVCFTNIAAFVEGGHGGLCWGAAYAIGNILSWLISQLSESMLTSLQIIPVICIFVGIALVPSILSETLPHGEMFIDRNEHHINAHLSWSIIIIVLMSIIYTIGSTDYSMIAETMTTSSTFYTRCFYAAGLLLAGILYDRSHVLGAALALASIVYPIMAYMLLKADFQINLVYCFSFFALGFFAVYRACTFISIGNGKKSYLFMACLGLLISRLTEGLMALINVPLTNTGVGGFLIAGLLFIPLIVVFCMMILNQEASAKSRSNDEKLADLSESRSLTRRESEILALIISGATNGEIADNLTISQATVRFHVSNVLKKLECSSRTDLINMFQKMK